MEESYCMFYMPVYLITIPSMYVLLVVYSFFNLWNVSWGTREVATKKSKAELEKEKKENEQRMAELKKKKKEGLLGTLMDQFNLGRGVWENLEDTITAKKCDIQLESSCFLARCHALLPVKYSGVKEILMYKGYCLFIYYI